MIAKVFVLTQFSDLGLAEPILAALAAKGYSTPTPIQAQAIPDVLKGRDLLGIAATGTGKTAAFALPILNRLALNPQRPTRSSVRMLILSPTRELAQQIAESFRAYGANLRMRVTTLIGGMPMRPQSTALIQGVDIIVATPGRLLDHVEQGNVRLDAVEVMVLDEADHMLDLGFIPAIRRIVRALPKVRQNLFFSATMPSEISSLAGDMLKDPVQVSVTPESTPAERVAQTVIFVEQPRKAGLLAQILRSKNLKRTLVFARTKHGSDKIVRSLEAAGIDALAIHGNKSQGQRVRALHLFKTGEVSVLVATDIAARGIDIDDIGLVINYDLPHVPETYVHRIGRTARAGADGEAIAFCNGEEKSLLRVIEKVMRSRIPVQVVEGMADIPVAPREERSFDEPRRSDRGGYSARSDRGGERSDRGPRKPRRDDAQGAGAGRFDDKRGKPAHRKGPPPVRTDASRNDVVRTDAVRPESEARPDRKNSEGARRFGPRPGAPKGDGPRNRDERGLDKRSADKRGTNKWVARPAQGEKPRGEAASGERAHHHGERPKTGDRPKSNGPRPHGDQRRDKGFHAGPKGPGSKGPARRPAAGSMKEGRARHA